MIGSRSLMDFVDAPILVGDPDGRVVYVNPAFEREFDRSRQAVSSQPLALVFEGGGREAILAAVARICAGESALRFHMRESGRGFLGLASPVEVEEGRVGVIVVLAPQAGDERLLAFQRAIRDPLEELAACLLTLADESDDGSDNWRSLVAEGLRAIERIRNCSEAAANSGR